MSGVKLVKDPRSERRRHKRLSAAVVAAALGAGALMPVAAAQPAFAGQVTKPNGSETAQKPTQGKGTESAGSAESLASRRAADTGKQVEVMEKRDEHTQVLANPDGTFTWKQFARPAFAKVKGKWQATDATLKKTADGRITPAAATFGLSFSGGGTTPLATMDKGGKSLSLTWPKALPEPSVDGATATYPEVLPGVDLKIIAEADGFAQHLVVKTVEAAGNPELAELSFGLKSKGVDLQADAEGNLKALDSAGKELFSAPTPAMWDSSHLSKAELGKARAGGEAQEEAPPSKLTDMDTKVVGNQLKITPDAKVFKDPKTVFPVVIDPIFSGGGRINWTMAYKQSGNSSLAGTSYWNGGSFKDKLARVGHETDTGGTSRAYFQMDVKGLKDAQITSATFNAFNSHAWSCTKTPVELGWTGAIDSKTTWNKQPTWNRTVQEKTFAHGWSASSCPAAGEDFTSDALKTLVSDVAATGAAELTLGLRSRASHETSNTSWKKFHNNPHLEVIYNHPPKLDASAAYEGAYAPGGVGNKPIGCSTDPAEYPVIGANDVTLTAKVSDPDGGKVTAAYSIYEDGTSLSAPAVPVSSGETAQTKLAAASLKDGSTYTWKVQAKDDDTASAWSSTCGFKVSATPPTKPVVTSADEHPLDVASLPARHDRKIAFASTSAGELDGFCYTINKPLAVSNSKCANGTFVKAGADGKATVTVKPSLYPLNKLHVQAYDTAGNTSGYDGHDVATDTTVIHTKRPEYVHDEHGRVHGDLPGDLDGDGHVDMLAIDAEGRLRHYGGNGDGSLQSAKFVEHGGWDGAHIAHRGDFISATEGQSKDGYEDYFVSIGNKLYLYPGDGSGMPLADHRKELIHPTGHETGPLTGPGAKCVDVKTSRTDNGTTIQIHDCNQTEAQDFELTDGALKVMGKCVATSNGGAQSASVQLWDCTGSTSQRWVDRGDGSLLNPVSGRCLDLKGGNTANGTVLQTSTCNRGTAQKWNVPGSWTGIGQILAPGNVDGKTGNDLIVQQGQTMWTYSGTALGHLEMESGTYKLKPGKQFGWTGWDTRDWTAPGDINGDGIPDLLARHTTEDMNHAEYGKLLLYPGKHTTDADGNTVYGTGTKSVYGTGGWNRAAVPLLASAGNVQGEIVDTGHYKKFVPKEGQETPDFWATRTGGDAGTGILRFYPGQTDKHGSPIQVGASGWGSIHRIF